MFPGATSPIRVIQQQRGFGYGLSGTSGIIAAALGANSVIFATKCAVQAVAANTDANARLQCVIQRMKIAFTCITAFTTPVTAARRLTMHRASNAGAEIGGGVLIVPVKKDTRAPASIMTPTQIGNVAGITVGGLTLEADPLATFDLAHCGNAGQRQDFVLEHAPVMSSPLCLNPGDYLAIQNPVAMDAGGTFQFQILELEWNEMRADEKGL